MRPSVEAMRGRQALWLQAKVPLAEDRGGVAALMTSWAWVFSFASRLKFSLNLGQIWPVVSNGSVTQARSPGQAAVPLDAWRDAAHRNDASRRGSIGGNDRRRRRGGSAVRGELGPALRERVVGHHNEDENQRREM